MCPVFMPDLYTREQQLATASGELNQAIMRKILQKKYGVLKIQVAK